MQKRSLFIIIYFFSSFFNFLEFYLFICITMKFSFSWPKQEKYSLFYEFYIHNRFILQLSHLVNHVLISPYRSFWCIIDVRLLKTIDWQIGGAYCTGVNHLTGKTNLGRYPARGRFWDSICPLRCRINLSNFR